MELEEYVASVLVGVCAGVDKAKNLVKTSAVAPATIDGEIVDRGEFINFEISVTVSDSSEGKGGGKIQVLPLGVSAEAKVNREMMNVNKLSFRVPIYFSATFKGR
jgi:hypothetical protein